MLYVSSACVKHHKIKDSIEELAQNGFKNIELSGGTTYYDGYEEDLLRLKNQYALNYLVHNYFPPPQHDFILNLASLNDDVYQSSMDHCIRAVGLCRKLEVAKFGIHAGFYIDFATKEIGKDISATEIADREIATDRFCTAYNQLKNMAEGIQLYLENNVLSSANAKSFHGQNPFMMTDSKGYSELKERIDFPLLLDVAHLRVSALSLGLDFLGELNKMTMHSDYMHISDNDGISDRSECFSEGSDILTALKNFDLHNKVLTLETRGSISGIKSSYLMAQGLLNEKNR